MKKRIYKVIVGLAFMAVCLTGCSKPGEELPDQTNVTVSEAEKKANGAKVQKRAEELAEQTAVTIGEEEITMDQVVLWMYSEEKEAAQYEYMYRLYYNLSFLDTANPETGKTARESYKDYVMNSAIQYSIFAQEAKALDITLTEEEKAENQALVDSFFSMLTVTEMERGGFTREVVGKTVEKMALAEKYYNFMIETFQINEDEIVASINKDDYKEYETEYLYLPTASYDENYKLVERTDAEKAEDYAFMLQVLDQLKAGKTMEEVKEAETDSALTYTTKTFLEYGTDTDRAYIDAAKELENGEYSKVVETSYGYYIILMKNNACTTSYEAALDEAYGLKVNELFAEEYAKLEEKYAPVINEEVWGAVNFGNYVVDETDETVN